MRIYEERSDELRRRVYWISTYIANISVRNVAAANFCAASNVTSSRFARRSMKDWFKQVLNGVKWMHERGVAHRDLKPENLLFSPSSPDILKIADFGLSAMIHENHKAPATPDHTPTFMTPTPSPPPSLSLPKFSTPLPIPQQSPGSSSQNSLTGYSPVTGLSPLFPQMMIPGSPLPAFEVSVRGGTCLFRNPPTQF